MNTPSIVRCCVRTTEIICSLPPIAVQDWTHQCAAALTNISPGSTALCLAARIDPSSTRLEVFSAGVAQHQDDTRAQRSSPLDHHLIALQDQAERLTALGLELPQHTMSRGLISPLEAIDSRWYDTAIGRTLNTGQQRTHPILMIVPIASERPGICLINCITGPSEIQASDDPDSFLITAALEALYPILRERADQALGQVSNPRAWLTERERTILDLLIEGHSVRVIAERLGRSSHTVHDHVKNLHKKIHASSRGELIARAMGHHEQPSSQSTAAPIVLGEHRDRIMELKPDQSRARYPGH